LSRISTLTISFNKKSKVREVKKGIRYSRVPRLSDTRYSDNKSDTRYSASEIKMRHLSAADILSVMGVRVGFRRYGR